MKLLKPHDDDALSAREAPIVFADLYRQHFAFVWRCLRGLGVPPAGLDDAAQDVFLAVHRQLPGFRGDAEPRTWLYAITRHVAANHRRRHQRKSAVLDTLAPHLHEHLHDPGPDPLARAADAEAASFVARFLESLAPKKRELFLLAFMEEMTMPEVAAALSLPLNTAYTQFRRVKAEFLRAWERHDHEGR